MESVQSEQIDALTMQGVTYSLYNKEGVLFGMTGVRMYPTGEWTITEREPDGRMIIYHPKYRVLAGLRVVPTPNEDMVVFYAQARKDMILLTRVDELGIHVKTMLRSVYTDRPYERDKVFYTEWEGVALDVSSRIVHGGVAHTKTLYLAKQKHWQIVAKIVGDIYSRRWHKTIESIDASAWKR